MSDEKARPPQTVMEQALDKTTAIIREELPGTIRDELALSDYPRRDEVLPEALLDSRKETCLPLARHMLETDLLTIPTLLANYRTVRRLVTAYLRGMRRQRTHGSVYTVAWTLTIASALRSEKRVPIFLDTTAQCQWYTMLEAIRTRRSVTDTHAPETIERVPRQVQSYINAHRN